MSKAQPRLGFLGLGWIGLQRMQSIMAAGTGEVVALADPDAELLAAAGRSAPSAKQLHSLAELLNLSLDGVVIATPSALHAAQATAALEAGLAVFCQKPLGRRGSEVETAIAVARRKNRLLGVDLSYRHVAGMARLRELVSSGGLGKIFAADLVFHNAYGPQKPWFYDRRLSGGGCLIDLGIHLVDAALWALSTDVREVSGAVFAKGHPLPPAADAVEDYATARLTLLSGAVVNLSCSWHLHAGRPAVIRAAFYGETGGVALENRDGSYTDFETRVFRGTTEEVIALPPDDWGGRAAVAWARQLATHREFDPAIERQVQVARTLDAIYQSSNSPITVA